MTANKSVAHRLGRVLETVTRQSGRVPETPDYGSWLLGKSSESQRRRRVRIQFILTVFIVIAEPARHRRRTAAGHRRVPGAERLHRRPDVDHLRRGTRLTSPSRSCVGIFWITRRTVNALRWAIEERKPTPEDQLNTFLAPWRVAKAHLILWGVGDGAAHDAVRAAGHEVHSAVLVRRQLRRRRRRDCVLPAHRVRAAPGGGAGTGGGPAAASAHRRNHGPDDDRVVARIGCPVVGIALLAVFALSLRNLTQTQFAIAVWILAVVALLVGFMLMWILSWLTATPVRVVRAALNRVEQGDLDCNVVVFDGTELGELQRGFNSMVDGLRERERVRDLFGRHVGREVAAAAEQQRPKLGGEERHVAVIFVDIIGSTQLVTGRPATEVVDLLNRFFAVIVDEVDRHHGFVNKFEGDAALAVFGAPNHLDNPEDEALAAGRAIARRIRNEAAGVRSGDRRRVRRGGRRQCRRQGALRVHRHR